MNSSPYLLSTVIFLPLLGVAAILLAPGNAKTLIRSIALVISAITFVYSLKLFTSFATGIGGFQLIERFYWLNVFGAEITYYVGIDGISLLLILLTTFITPIIVLSSFAAVDNRVKEYYICFLLLETAMVGTFSALDLVLFYVFWEAMLIPMYFIIGVWGGPRRIYAAIKFVLFTMVGSVLMLAAIVMIAIKFHEYQGGPTYTFDLLAMYRADFLDAGMAQNLMFLAFCLAFAIKVPMFPFHTWLPDAHVEAPTAGSVILASVLLKMGTYGLLRFAIPLFPDAVVTFMPAISILAIVGIIYGALVAMVQPDLKKLVAYSSVSHLGFVVLGLFALNDAGIRGAIYQMLNHGLSTGLLFLSVGVIYERRHTRMIAEFGGLASIMPLFTVGFMIATLSSIGLPGLNGFWGEFPILLGAFQRLPLYGVLAATGVILGAVYMLFMFKRVMFGKILNPANERLPDLNPREIMVFAPMVLVMFVMGVFPKPFFEIMEPAVNQVIERHQRHTIGSSLSDENVKIVRSESDANR